MKKFFANMILSVLSLIFLVSPTFASNLYLVPSATNVSKGQTFSVQVRLNSLNEAQNALSAYLSYPTDKLAVVSVEPDSTFDMVAENTIDGNTIKVSQGSIDPVFGDVPVYSIIFKSIMSGTARLDFTSDSAVMRYADSTNSLSNSAGLNLNIHE